MRFLRRRRRRRSHIFSVDTNGKYDEKEISIFLLDFAVAAIATTNPKFVRQEV